MEGSGRSRRGRALRGGACLCRGPGAPGAPCRWRECCRLQRGGAAGAAAPRQWLAWRGTATLGRWDVPTTRGARSGLRARLDHTLGICLFNGRTTTTVCLSRDLANTPELWNTFHTVLSASGKLPLPPPPVHQRDHTRTTPTTAPPPPSAHQATLKAHHPHHVTSACLPHHPSSPPPRPARTHTSGKGGGVRRALPQPRRTPEHTHLCCASARLPKLRSCTGSGGVRSPEAACLSRSRLRCRWLAKRACSDRPGPGSSSGEEDGGGGRGPLSPPAGRPGASAESRACEAAAPVRPVAPAHTSEPGGTVQTERGAG